MRISFVRSLSLIATTGFGCGSLFSQTMEKPVSTSSKTEPGLELAVKWKWWVAPAEKKEWGMPLPEALVPKSPGTQADQEAKPAEVRPQTYEVKKGDAVIKIAKKFDMAVWQLEHFNDLKNDLIHIGQILRIPTPGDLLTMIPPPPPEPKKEVGGKKKPEKAIIVSEPVPDPGGEAQRELENVRLQVFLDREMFSPGIIDGKAGPTFIKISEIYQQSHTDAANSDQLKAKAEAALKEPYTRYILRGDDFKFIKLPKYERVGIQGNGLSSAKKKNPKADKAAPALPPTPPLATIDELVAADFLGYTSPWEFVAERFHCDEAFLHHINPQLKATPVVGTELQVPNVIPFEIEKALDAPLQPAADPQKLVTTAVVVLSRLEISCEGKLIAVMPLTTARPGLHGRGSWKVLDAIPQPRMATKREPRDIPKEKPASAGIDVQNAKPPLELPLEKEQYLAPGPNNPVGIIWINLAKSGTTDPLPYGMHGTSIPAQMSTLQSIGGLRLTNWNIARAVRLMPVGTALQWKAQ